jgi:hypothetical protein
VHENQAPASQAPASDMQQGGVKQFLPVE